MKTVNVNGLHVTENLIDFLKPLMKPSVEKNEITEQISDLDKLNEFVVVSLMFNASDLESFKQHASMLNSILTIKTFLKELNEVIFGMSIKDENEE